jgi:arginyl-tRNA--protein-N-Asp/Glu arginylyltransferase
MKFRVVWDQPEPCPYLPGQTARLPLCVPSRKLSPAELDARLEAGDRRTGRMLYGTFCPSCTACEPLRVPVAQFAPSDSQRRVVRRNSSVVSVEMGPVTVDEERLRIFNRHKLERDLSTTGEPMTAMAYHQWFSDTCCDTREVRYRIDEKLVAVSILDVGATAASSVYHYFDPDHAHRSLGVYSVLAEIELCRQIGLSWYYLGYYVRDCSHLAYKASYWPHERRVGGVWTRFERRAPAESAVSS